MQADAPVSEAWSHTDLVAFVRRGVRVAPAMIEQMKAWPGVDFGLLAGSVRQGLNELVERGELGRYTPSGTSYVHFLPEEALDAESAADRRERIRAHILRKMTPGAWIAGTRLHLEVGAGSKQEVKLAVRSLVDDGYGKTDPFASIGIALSARDLIDDGPVRGAWPAVRHRLSAKGCAYLAQHPERPEPPAKEPEHVVPDLASGSRAELIHVLDQARRLKREAKEPVFIALDENGRLKVVVGFGESAKEPQTLATVRTLRAAVALYQSGAEDILAEIRGPADLGSEPRPALLITERFMALARWGDWSDRAEFVKRVKFGAVPLFCLSEPDRDSLRKCKAALLRQFA